MGRDHVDVFSALLSRNLCGILCRILGLLGDLDLIRYYSSDNACVLVLWGPCVFVGTLMGGFLQLQGREQDVAEDHPGRLQRRGMHSENQTANGTHTHTSSSISRRLLCSCNGCEA